MSRSLEDELDLISLRRYRDSLQATRTMLKEMRILAEEAQSELLELVAEFCGAEWPEHRPQDADKSPAALGGILRDKFRILNNLDAQDLIARLEAANHQIGELQTDREALRHQAEVAEARLRKLDSRNRSLEQSLEKLHHPIPGPMQVAPEIRDSPSAGAVDELDFQTWFTKWAGEDRNFKRNVSVVQALGNSGELLVKDLEKSMAADRGQSRSTITRAVADCLSLGLITRLTKPTPDDRPAQAVTLTPMGEWVFQQLTGEGTRVSTATEPSPAPIADNRTAITLRVADQFERLGFQVDRRPAQMQMDGERSFAPDLIARKAGETFDLVVVIGGGDQASLTHKWENALQAGDRICVVADNLSNLRRIQGDLIQWAESSGQKIYLLSAHLDDLVKKSPGETPWFSARRYRFY